MRNIHHNLQAFLADCQKWIGSHPLPLLALALLGPFVAFSVPATLAETDTAHKPKGMIDFNLYPYQSRVDTDTLYTLNIASTMTDKLSYFGFINFSNQDDSTDSINYYAEQNLFWSLSDYWGIDITSQAVLISGSDNDKLRFGMRFRAQDAFFSRELFEWLNLRYTLNLHAIQFDHSSANVWQMEHAFYLRFPYLTDRLYLAGFMDHTFGEDLPSDYPSAPIVAEAQLGYRLFDRVFLIGEYRINQYRRDNTRNFAAGFEYKITF